MEIIGLGDIKYEVFPYSDIFMICFSIVICAVTYLLR
jgi:hypothetical protein